MNWKQLALRFDIGLRHELLIRQVIRNSGSDSCRVCYISDIHLRPGRTAHLSTMVLQACRRASPHRILLGGDLLDKSSELEGLSSLCLALSQVAPTYAVAGNHDMAVGLKDVRKVIESSNCSWIHDCSASWTHQGREFSVAGPDYHGTLNTPVRILCGHNPRIWKSAKKRAFDLVLAGHLHGCQWVAFQYRNRLYPGAWFYPYCYLELIENRKTLVVSRGIADLVPFRLNCPREIILCHL